MYICLCLFLCMSVCLSRSVLSSQHSRRNRSCPNTGPTVHVSQEVGLLFTFMLSTQSCKNRYIGTHSYIWILETLNHSFNSPFQDCGQCRQQTQPSLC